jgi:uncharacterized protein (TIGR03437 family)
MAVFPVLATAASTSLQFVPPTSLAATGVLANGVLPLSGGGVAVYGAQTTPPCSVSAAAPDACHQIEPPLLAILDASGNQTLALAASALGGGNSIITSAAADSSGNIWITGSSDSDDFPLVHALYTNKIAYQMTGFAVKLDPTLNILFSTLSPAQAAPQSIALDASGNAYVAGNTNDATFPVTGPVFGSGTPSANPLAPAGYVFVLKLASDGSKLLYSRLLGGSSYPCRGGSSCIGVGPYTAASAIAVDVSGEATVGGQTDTSDFPMTANVYNTAGAAFVSRIAADGSALVWSTKVGTTTSIVESLALDAAGSVYIAGGSGVPATNAPPTVVSGFVLKLSSDATQLIYATNLGGTNGANLSGLALDSSGNIWVSGFTASPDFPGLSAMPPNGLDFALELNANATAVEQIFPLIPQTVTQPPAFDSNGNLLLLASAGNLLRLNAATAYSAPAAFAITNAAIPRAAASVAPGEIMTIYGVGLGPSSGIVATPDAKGAYPTALGGVSVQTDGPTGAVSVPLLYVSSTQINFEVPPDPYQPSTLAIITPSGSLPPMNLNVAGSIGIFGVINSDGSVNSAANPAKAGSIVSLYLTGLGLATYDRLDGFISPSAIAAFTNLVEVNANGNRAPLALLYAGTAPGAIDGLDQINVELPAATQNPTLTITVPFLYNTTLPATSNAVTVYTQ